MTVPVGSGDPSGSGPAAEVHSHQTPHLPTRRPRSGPSATEAVAATCPHLVSADGRWRTVTPSRDHRCGAHDPPTAQPTDKQRRHCLSPDHVECPIFRAARDARVANLAAGADPALVEAADRGRRPLARTAPILLEPGRLVDQSVRLNLDRTPGQVALVALMVVAFGVVAIARLSADGAPLPSTPPEPSPLAALPSRSPAPGPSASVAPSASAAPSASVAPSPSAAPSFRTTYRVKKGDTLITIARRYGTSAAAIRALNGLTSSTLKIGQVLKIP